MHSSHHGRTGHTARFIQRKSRPVLAGLLLGAAMLLPVAHAEDAKVLATVDGAVITEADMNHARAAFAQNLQQVSAGQKNVLLLNALIEFKLLSHAAEAADMDKTESFKTRLAWARTQALRDIYIRAKVADTITEADVKARYEKLAPEQEVHARHILVKTEPEAKAIIAELAGGGDFAELAKTKSTGPSGPNGGDLGFFGRGRMVPAFEAAAFALKPGEHTNAPVKTKFGWHIIEAMEVRAKAAPPYKTEKPKIQEALLSERLQAALQDLRSKAKIEIKK